eukprot:6771822-Prymnesium_polylepis.2
MVCTSADSQVFKSGTSLLHVFRLEILGVTSVSPPQKKIRGAGVSPARECKQLERTAWYPTSR